jgi:hypothetical protein
VDAQSGSLGTHKDNMGAADQAGTSCADTLNGYAGDFDKLKKKMQDDEKCKDEAKQAGQKAAAARQGAAQCKGAGAAAQGQGDTSKGNEKKMGDNKKDGKGSPGGGPPSPPSPPKGDDKKKDPKPDPLAQLRQQQALIAKCNADADAKLAAEKAQCEANFPVNTTYIVPDNKKKQEECKQSAIFTMQGTKANVCEKILPPPPAPAN